MFPEIARRRMLEETRDTSLESVISMLKQIETYGKFLALFSKYSNVVGVLRQWDALGYDVEVGIRQMQNCVQTLVDIGLALEQAQEAEQELLHVNSQGKGSGGVGEAAESEADAVSIPPATKSS